MQTSYDPEADAAYITVGAPILPGTAVAQLGPFATPSDHGEVILDFDAEGRLLGVEVLGARRILPPELLPDER